MKLHAVIMQCDVCILCSEWRLLWIGVSYFRSSPLGRLRGWQSLLSKGLLRYVAVYAERMQDIQARSVIQQDDLFLQKIGLEFQEETNEMLRLEYSFLWGWNRPPLWSSGQSFWLTDTEVSGSIPGATRFSE